MDFRKKKVILFLPAYLLINLVAFSQPTNTCTNYTGTGIPVGDQCVLYAFNTDHDNDYWNSATGCSGTDHDDSYWWFTATSETTIITYYPTGGNNSTGGGANYNPILTLFSGSCATNMTHLACANANGNGEPETIVYNTTIGTNYRVRIQNNNSNDPMFGRICVMNQQSSGDDPCTAVDLTVNSTCRTKWFTNVGSTYTSNTLAPNPTCGGYSANREDVWFRVTMPATDLVVTTELNGTNGTNQTNSNSMNNSNMSIYRTTGGCASGDLTQVSCDTDAGLGNMSQIHVVNGSGSGEIPTGTVLYVRIWANADANTNNGPFGICAFSSTKCGNPMGLLNDFCENPAEMYKQPGTSFTASTAGVFTIDHGDTYANGGAGLRTADCGGGSNFNLNIHNNSWYQFTATATTEVFPFTIQSGCTGMQAVVFQITYNANGCCTGFTQRSNCSSNMPTTSQNIIATGLTVGATYLLMVDGVGGAQCDFTIQDWNANNVLSIDLESFSGIEKEDHNLIQWTTVSEKNNDYFTLYRSYDGVDWEAVNTVKGAGTSSNFAHYELQDFDVRVGFVYYRLKQTDFDGKSSMTNIIALNRKTEDSGIITIYPNPSSGGNVTIDLYTKNNDGTMQIFSVEGKIVFEKSIIGKGAHSVYYDMSQLKRGVYTVKYSDDSITSVRQLIKNK
jgi:hypothetical protein